MSQSTAKGKVIGRFTIGFDDETKASIADLKSTLDAVPYRLKFGNVMPIGGLLAAMQDAAANDSNGVVRHGGYVKPELKQLVQWVFEGRDEKFQSAAVDRDGSAFLYQDKKSELKLGELKKHFVPRGLNYVQIDGVFDTTNWQDSAIDRETINDVEYLSETVPDINGVEANFIIIDELQSDWLSESVPQITQADMQLIFIKNLSECLIQRMHSMNRFSEDDYAISDDKLMSWDIVVGYNSFNDQQLKFAIVIATSKIEHSDQSGYGIADLTSCFSLNQYVHTGQYVKILYSHNSTYRTITEAELPAFRAALEACYA